MWSWLEDLWDDYKEAMWSAAVICFVIAGAYVAYKRPPRDVQDRHWFTRPVSVCDGQDSKGNCTGYHTEIETVYVLVSTDGATCEVASVMYFMAKQGDRHKCWQLFGWRGGASDDEINAHQGRF